jgi:hypothetical protein
MDINNLVMDLDKFNLAKSDSEDSEKTEKSKLSKGKCSENVYWLYSARSGWWWLYDEDSTKVLEYVYQCNGKFATLNLSNGNVVTIDFGTNRQTTTKGKGGMRNVKRCTDLTGLKVRGISGTYY